MKKRLLLPSSALMILAGGLLQAQTINVPTDQSTISAAIAAASAGTTIVVDASAYPTETTPLEIEKNLTIQSVNGKVAIQAANSFLGAVHISGAVTEVTLDNLAITNTESHGIYVETGITLNIDNCNVDGNGNDGAESGLWVADIGGAAMTINITDSTFNENWQRGWTIDFDGQYTINATNVEVDDNGELGILIGAAGTLALDFDTVSISGNGARGTNNSNGALILKGSGTFTNCTIANNTNWGIDLTGATAPGRSYTFTNTTISGNRNRDGNDGGGAILFANAEYTLNNLVVDDNHRGVIAFSRIDGDPGNEYASTFELNGGAISNNTTVGFQTDNGPDGVAGISVVADGTSFNGNGEFGVGAFTQGTYSFTNCEFNDNTQNGFRRLFNAQVGLFTDVTIEDSIVAGNGGWGLWIDGQAADVTFNNVLFDDNANTATDQGNLFFTGDEEKLLEANRVRFLQGDGTKDNIALFGAITATLTNCLVENGGAVAEPDEDLVGAVKVLSGAFSDIYGPADVTLRHCTIVATGDGTNRNGVTIEIPDGANNAGVTVENTIISGFDAGVRFANLGGSGTPGYDGTNNLLNNTEDYAGGASAATGDIAGDPLFVDAGAGDYRLQAASPAVDAGVPLSPAVTDDINGQPRPVGSAPDIGAFEFDETSVSDWLLIN